MSLFRGVLELVVAEDFCKLLVRPSFAAQILKYRASCVIDKHAVDNERASCNFQLDCASLMSELKIALKSTCQGTSPGPHLVNFIWDELVNVGLNATNYILNMVNALLVKKEIPYHWTIALVYLF